MSEKVSIFKLNPKKSSPKGIMEFYSMLKEKRNVKEDTMRKILELITKKKKS